MQGFHMPPICLVDVYRPFGGKQVEGGQAVVGQRRYRPTIAAVRFPILAEAVQSLAIDLRKARCDRTLFYDLDDGFERSHTRRADWRILTLEQLTSFRRPW